MAATAPAKRLAFKILCVLKSWQLRFSERRVRVYYLEGIFARKARALAELLAAHGFVVEVHTGLSRETRVLMKAGHDLWIGFWNCVPPGDLPKHYVLWNAEPLALEKWSASADWRDDLATTTSYRWPESAERRRQWHQAIVHSKAVWGYLQTNAVYVEKAGVPFAHVPFGYSATYEALFQKAIGAAVLKQDIDVLFVGSLTDRRGHILDAIKKRGLAVQVVSQANPVVGDELDRLIARSKIVLGIHGYDEPEAQIADLARFDYLLSNRVFAIHERPAAVVRHPEFELNVVTCEAAEFPEVCAHYLSRPEERRNAAETAYRWFKRQYALEKFVPIDQLRALMSQCSN